MIRFQALFVLISIFALSDSAQALPMCSIAHISQFREVTIKICTAKFGRNYFYDGEIINLYDENGKECFTPCGSVPRK